MQFNSAKDPKSATTTAFFQIQRRKMKNHCTRRHLKLNLENRSQLGSVILLIERIVSIDMLLRLPFWLPQILFYWAMPGKTSDCIGRRYTIVLAAATFLMGALLMGFAPSFSFLMAGRLVAGIGVGYSLMIAPVYTAEISPSTARGFLSSLPEVFINIGILLGYISNYALSNLPENINWRLMLGFAALPAIAVALGVMVMPESPRWLIMKGRFAEAKLALIKTSNSEEEAEFRLTEMTKAAEPTSSSNNWHGNDAVVYYSPEVFRDAGISSRKQLVGVTVIMGIAKTSFVFISALFLDRFGRRPLILLGSCGMAISLTLLGLGSKYLEQSNGNPEWAIALCVVAVCADVSFFSIGLGPVTWVYSSEIFPTRFRAQGSSLAISVNRLVSGIVAMTFLSISREITFGGMFFALAGIMGLGTVFFYFFYLKRKGRAWKRLGYSLKTMSIEIKEDLAT
ncbi:hypothetical protein Patl1_13241 [Pistacia atlantica]|uniref:Uncharacterized protein n=1 Tax=Pistacia atlantica TaxID=434234 RepID=A0ACC1ATK1_9ROSI|nr:hypothetical protein Patl1_13241 [Pistacia atlantica]